VYVLLRKVCLKNVSYFLLIGRRYQKPDYIASKNRKISALEISKVADGSFTSCKSRT